MMEQRHLNRNRAPVPFDPRFQASPRRSASSAARWPCLARASASLFLSISLRASLLELLLEHLLEQRSERSNGASDPNDPRGCAGTAAEATEAGSDPEPR